MGGGVRGVYDGRGGRVSINRFFVSIRKRAQKESTRDRCISQRRSYQAPPYSRQSVGNLLSSSDKEAYWLYVCSYSSLLNAIFVIFVEQLF